MPHLDIPQLSAFLQQGEIELMEVSFGWTME